MSEHLHNGVVEEASGLSQTATWKSALVVSLGGSLLVAVSLGAMAAELGAASIAVWSLVAFVGVIQCFIIAELAAMFPHKTGGTPVYAHEGFKKISPLIGAISNWGYWFGWIPVIAVNLVLAAGYFKASFYPSLDIVTASFIMIVPMFVLNYFGLRMGVVTSAIMGICAIVPLTLIALSPLFREGLFQMSNILPMEPAGGSWTSATSWMLLAKWAFVGAWSAYAFESASTVVAEMKNPHSEAPKGMIAASAVGVLSYVVTPVVMLGILGIEQMKQDPSIAFMPAAQAIFGPMGGTMVSVMLIAALLLGAQTAIIGSSRTLMEMSRDGLTIKQFAKVNKYGVPVGSMLWNFLVTVGCLAIFKADIVSLVACSNVGYLVPFMLVPFAFVMLRYQKPQAHRPYKLPSVFIPLALGTGVFNWVLFFVGGSQWGKSVMFTGGAILLAFLPFYAFRLYSDKKGKHSSSVEKLFKGDSSKAA